MIRDAWLVALVCVNAYFLATTLSNIAFMRRATRKARIKSGPYVSVIVPARNEERSIARCVESLLAQDYADYEIIVVDDESEDATAEIVVALAAHNARLRLVSSGPLCAGWLGKPHALWQGTAVARGEILVLTDADTVHTPQSISWAVTNLQDHQADLLSGYLNQVYGSFGERFVVPTMYAMMLLVPLFLIPRTKSPGLAFSIGQFVAVRRDALDGVGGFEAIANSIVDDMSMAARMKQFGYRTVFLDANEAASCRLYTGFRDAFTGIERSIYSAVGGNPVQAILTTAALLGLIIGPAFSLLTLNAGVGMPASALAVCVGLFATAWALLAWDRNIPLSAVVLYPLVFLNLVAILNASMLSTGFGLGVSWKGRLVRTPRSGDVVCEPEPSPGK